LKIPLKYTSLGICRNPDPEIENPWDLVDYCAGIDKKIKPWESGIPVPEFEIHKIWFILHSGAGNLKFQVSNVFP